MARLIARADGLFTAAATWGVVDATSLNDSDTNSANITAVYVESTTFTPGAITIDGIAVRVATRLSASAATMSVRLAQAGALVAGTEVTINVSDLPTANIGWVFFKLAAPVTLLAATLYSVSIKTSTTIQITCHHSGGTNWARMLRTTTTAAPAAGDVMSVLGEWTAPATKTDRTVTMDSTAATDYGSASTTLTSLGISKGGILTWGTTAATNYILRLSGLLTIWADGLMNMGTVATPCPRDSSMQLEFDCTTALGDFGIQAYGQLVTQGLSRTAGKDVVQCLLNTDEAAAQVTLGVDTDTGWLLGDEIAIASTTTTGSQGEERTLGANAGASTLAVSVVTTNAHSGTSPTQAEVILLNRNVRIRAVNAAFMGYIQSGTLSVIDMDWTEVRYMGVSSAKPALLVASGSAGSINVNFCCYRDNIGGGAGICASGAAWGNFTIEDTVTWKVGHVSASGATIQLITSTLGGWAIRRCTFLNNLTNQGHTIRLANYNGTIEDVRIAGGGGEGVYLEDADGYIGAGHTWSGFVVHSMGNYGFYLNGLAYGRITDTTVWRCADGGMQLQGDAEVLFEDFDWFGNGVNHITFAISNGTRILTMRNGTFAGDSTFATPRAMTYPAGGSPYGPITFENVTFGVANGIRVAHSVADLDLGSGADYRISRIFLNNCFLTTGIVNATGLGSRQSAIHYQRVQQVAGVHKTVYQMMGTVSLDTVLFRTAAPSAKLEPTNALLKLESGPVKKSVALGATRSISVYVQKNVAYNGNAPRLMQRCNPSLGIDDDVVLATFSAAAGVWQQLSATTAAAEDAGQFEFYVDCDGTAGQVNVDDWE
jgi:hypothetical protein